MGGASARVWSSTHPSPWAAMLAGFTCLSSTQPAAGNPIIVAGSLGQMEPLVHPRFERGVATRQEPGHLTVLQWLVGIHGAQSGARLLLDDGLDRLRNHHVGVALEDLVENGRVVVEDNDLGLLEVRARKTLVASPRILDHGHARLVDVNDRLKLGDVLAFGDGCLAVDHIGRRKECALLAIERYRDAAYRDVAFIDKILH